jgi:hypothetical protein
MMQTVGTTAAHHGKATPNLRRTLTEAGRMKHALMISLIAALTTAIGCGNSGKVDLGNDKVATTGENLSDYAGDWEGYAEAYQWNDGTDAVAIRLDKQGNGVIEVGKADPLPKPNPDASYPPDSGSDANVIGPNKEISGLISGFSYPVSGAKVESKRIRLATSSADVIREWCELQTPVETKAGGDQDGWFCVPNVGFTSDANGCFLGSDKSMPIPCGKLACMFECTCTASGCEPTDGGALDVQLDAALESNGDQLVGTLLVENQRVTVRMTRM